MTSTALPHAYGGKADGRLDGEEEGLIDLPRAQNNGASSQSAEHPPQPVSLHDARLLARSLAGAKEEASLLSLARAFVYRLVASWWRALTAKDVRPLPLRELLQPMELPRLPAPAAAQAESLGKTLAALDAETAAYEIGLTYTTLLPRAYRTTYGVYYTPPALAARLLTQATTAGVDWTRCRALDPACGGGAFLAPVARRIVSARHGRPAPGLLEDIAACLHGAEIDPFGAWLAQIAVDAVLLPIARSAGCAPPVVVRVCDSLRQKTPQEGFDLVISNPPYGKVRLEASERARFRRSLFGHANLYGLFTDLALQYTKPGGVIAYVTPTSFLAGEYFKNLRALLGKEAPPLTLDFVSSRRGVFQGVLQETLLATYRRSGAGGQVAVHEITPARDGLTAGAIGVFPLPSDRSSPWLLPRHRAQERLVRALSRMKHRLTDWGYQVSTGPLVWNRHKAQLTDQPGPGRYPLVWAEAVTGDGRFVWRAEKRRHALYCALRPGDDWLKTQTPCVLLQRTTAKEQRRRLVAACLPEDFLRRWGAVVIENHLNMLRPLTPNPPVPPEALAAFLNSATADDVFRCISGSVAVSAYELASLPLPAPDEISTLLRLVRAGAARDVLEAACARLYQEE